LRSNSSLGKGGGCGFTLSRSHSCCSVRLVYTQISPGHIWTTLYFKFAAHSAPVAAEMWRIGGHITVILPVRNLSWAEGFLFAFGCWVAQKERQSNLWYLKRRTWQEESCHVKENWRLFENFSWKIFWSDNWMKYIDSLATLLYACYTGILCVEIW